MRFFSFKTLNNINTNPKYIHPKDRVQKWFRIGRKKRDDFTERHKQYLYTTNTTNNKKADDEPPPKEALFSKKKRKEKKKRLLLLGVELFVVVSFSSQHYNAFHHRREKTFLSCVSLHLTKQQQTRSSSCRRETTT